MLAAAESGLNSINFTDMQDNSSPGPFKRDLPESIEPAEQSASPGMFRTYPVTAALVTINCLIFAAMAFISQGQSLSQAGERLMLHWGSNFGPLTLSGEYYRLVTSLFLHFDFMHILFNMWALWQVGMAVERLYGSGKFLLIYLLAGIAGSLNSLYFHPQSISAGASGAVFGAFGAFLVFLKIHEKRFDPKAVKATVQSIIVLLFFNLVFGMSHAFIDNAAHVGGFFGGVVGGWAACPKQAESKQWSAANLVATAIFAAALWSFLMLDVHKMQTGL